MLGEINQRTRINFPPIPYIFYKVWISWNFHPFHPFASRHDIHGSLVLLSFWSHSIRLQSVPPSLPFSDIREFPRWRKRGIRLEATDTPDSFLLLILSLFYDMPPTCAQFLHPFHATSSSVSFSLSRSPIFLPSSSSRAHLSFSKIVVDRLPRFFPSRCNVSS